MLKHLGVIFALAGMALSGAGAHAAQSSVQPLKTVRATELRADKLGSAAVVANLPAGAALTLLSSEGGWAWVEWLDAKGAKSASGAKANKTTGWVRAGALNWQADASDASALASGRDAAGATALTLGVRSLPARSNRHALIIGIGQYADPATPPLPGVRLDRESATQMAQSMQVPTENIRYLHNEQATGDNIRKALQDLTGRVQEGDRVFIHYSGHGTRYQDPNAGGCVEALLAYDGGQSGLITNQEMVKMLSGITNKTDKLFVMYDACHSGGVAQAASVLRTRGIVNSNDEGALRPKFAGISEECGKPTNVKTRNLVVEALEKGALSQDIIHLSASRNDEISFDDETKGGLATQYMRDCMLRDAKDLDGSGAISMDEIRQCAQDKIDKRMSNSDTFKPHHLVLNGNANFVPAWFGQGALTPVSAVAAVASPAAAAQLAVAPPVPPKPAAAAATAATTAAAPVKPAPPAAVAVVPPAPLTGEQALRQMYEQRDAKRKVQVTLSQDKLKIGKDALDFSVQSDRPGYLYVALAGSDNKSVYMLFPNDLDRDNKIAAGKAIQLPRANWRVKAGGPAGNDTLLVMVADAPRDLSQLGASKAGPFLSSLNDSQGRAQLGALLAVSQSGPTQLCANSASRAGNALCSDAYGASLINVEEVK